MQTIEGIFDGKIYEIEEIRSLAAQTDSFLFWKDEQEDIYQDYLQVD